MKKYHVSLKNQLPIVPSPMGRVRVGLIFFSLSERARVRLLFFALLSFFSLLQSCKTVVDKVEFDTELEVSIKNDLNQPIDGAQVAVYNSYTNFSKDILLGSVTGAIQTVNSQGGKAHFDNLEPEISYWIAAFYTDINKIAGARILYNNNEINNELAIKLRKGSISYVDVKMKPQEGVVTFIAPGSEKGRLPLTVKFNSSFEGNITKTFDANPLTLVDSTIHVLATKGKGYYVINSAACSWYDVTTVVGGQRTFVKLSPCEAGNIAFYCDDITPTEYPISISLNSQDVAPLTIDNAHDAVDCTTANLYRIEKASGSVTYSARSKSGKCVWVGKVEITTNQCTIVKLPKCR